MNFLVNVFKSIFITLFSGFILFIMGTQLAKAEEVYVSYGLGAFKSAENVVSETKITNAGVRLKIYSPWEWQIKLGGWLDGSGNPTRKSSFYTSTGPQYVINAGPVVIRNGIGLAYISNPDSYLGGRFPQFDLEVYVGLKNKTGSAIGFQLEHLSSAGINKPNIGRDFFVLQLSQEIL